MKGVTPDYVPSCRRVEHERLRRGVRSRTFRTGLLIRRDCTSEPGDGVTPEEDPTSLKKVSIMEGALYRANCLAGPQELIKRETMHLAPAATEGTAGVISQ